MGKLKVTKCDIEGLAIIEPEVHKDNRGYFVETYNQKDMEKAGLIGQLRDDTGGIRALGKVEKVYIDNPSLCYLLADGKPEVGNLRETFFYNQLRQVSNVTTSKVSDFEIDGRTFEVGGKSKGQKQIKQAAEGYIVKADIEFAHGNNIPLWHFGFLY